MFALGADTSIEVLRGRNVQVATRYVGTHPATILVPAIVAGELMVGALKSVRPNAVSELEAFLTRHRIAPFEKAGFRLYAQIRVHLETRGLKIGPNDLIVAATALALGATLVTHNVREFSRVPSLRIEDWQVDTTL